MLSTVQILCFAADPEGTLHLDEDVRKIRRKVGLARHWRALRFDWHLAVRANDILDALMEQRPQIVHFSGHGDGEGLEFVGADGRRHLVHTGTLQELFAQLGGGVRVVLLSACSSKAQAEAIRDAVGCAIGTRGEIPDDAAMTFNAEFYRSIASGYSVQAAYDQARLALEMNHYAFRDITELLVRDDVDASKLVLVSRRPALKAAGFAVAGLAVLASLLPPPRQPESPAWAGIRLGDCTSATTTAASISTNATAAADDGDGATGPAADLEQAKALCRAGDYAAAFKLFKSAAAALPEAMGFVGIAYQSGEGVDRDSAEAIEWLRKGASGDDPRSMNALAIAYQNGFDRGYGVQRQPRWARYWLEKAANEMGSLEATINLGLLYLEERQDSLALACFRRAAEAGSLDALVEIGRMHEEGRAVPRDPAMAVAQYYAAAQAGSARGMFEMGKVHQNGTGVARDLGLARTWYYRGACAGSADAMYHLGLLFRDGLGVPADRAEAVRWFRRAADAGSSVALASLEQLKEDREPRVPRLLAWLDPPHPDSVPGCTA